ncbi:hypothetical protein [Thermogemmatispora onikobensis]|uniref:hypothetical protein n=1 Tax=Thermogemmatispora onikobensis TaxID=732234 RepID=UPI00114D0089|nr:hypothetical protein [Thermogemmatispora onikobensis]
MPAWFLFILIERVAIVVRELRERARVASVRGLARSSRLLAASRVLCVWYYIQQRQQQDSVVWCGEGGLEGASDLCGEQSGHSGRPLFFSEVHLRQNTVIT